MSGVFGRGGFDSSVSREQWIGSHPRLDAFELRRLGIMRDGVAFDLALGEPVGHIHATVGTGKLTIGNQTIALAVNAVTGCRVFTCPSCARGCYHLHYVADAWACRHCHGLKYPCRSFAQLVRWARVQRLRKRLGASPEPFTPLPPMRLQARRQWRIAREIRALEEELIRNARHTADGLGKRLR